MKKLNLVFLFVLGLFINSCEDATNIIQDGEFGENATFRTIEDMQLWLNETYDRVDISNELFYSALATDELSIGSENGGQNISEYQYFIFADLGYASSAWLTQYTLINYVNRLLRGAQRITPTAEELPTYNNILAQARALRAFAYLNLQTYFSTNLADDNALGVLLVDFVPSIGTTIPRATNAQVFAFMEQDMDFASANLIEPTSATGYKFVTLNMINAMRARMYAYRGNYTLAEQFADQVINSSGLSLTRGFPIPTSTIGSGAWNSSFYGGSTTNPYRRMFADLDRGEIIFSLDRPVGKGSIAGLFYFNQTNRTGGPYHDMGRNLFNLLNEIPNDVRRRAFIDPTSLVVADDVLANPPVGFDFQEADVLCIDKYPGKTGAPLTSDLKVFRLAEMFLIKAEAMANRGDLNGASNSVASILQQIRNARVMAATPNVALPNYANATEAWADILKERRRELCFEGHRLIDLKRLGSKANAGVDRFTLDCTTFNVTTCGVPVTDYRFTMPIPVAELNANPVQQNPGY